MRRTRILEDETISAEYTVNIYNPNGTLSSSTDYLYNSYDIRHQVDDVVTPGWRKIIDSGGFINSPLLDERIAQSYTTAYAEFQNSLARNVIPDFPAIEKCHNGVGFNNIGETHSDFMETLDAAVARAKQEALARIEQAPFDFSEDALEFHKVLKTLRNPLSLAQNLSNEFQSRYAFYSSGKHRSVAQSIGKAWLEVRFAYRPIMISLENLLVGHNVVLATRRPATERHKVGSFKSISIGETVNPVYSNASGTIHYDVLSARTGSASGSAGIIYEVTNPLRDWRWKYGLRNRDLVRAVYNVMPYSWVVDRFYNINDSLRGLMNIADSTVTIRAGWEKRQWDYAITESVVDASYTGGTGSVYTTPPVGATGVTSLRRKHRIPWHPGVTDTAPRLFVEKMSSFPEVFDLTSLVLARMRPVYKPGHHLI